MQFLNLNLLSLILLLRQGRGPFKMGHYHRTKALEEAV